MTLTQTRADDERRRAWCSGRARSARSSTSRAGTDWRWVDGDSEENGLDASTGTQVTLKRVSGGTQRSLGAFVQDLIVPVPQLTLTLQRARRRLAQLRRPQPRNEPDRRAGEQRAVAARTGATRSPARAPRHATTSPIGSTCGADLGWGFRAPTLNELYRQFRVGQTLTLANNALGPERLVGGETGRSIAASPERHRSHDVVRQPDEDPVSNVTISQVGTNVTQQRQNLGRTHIWGIQNDVEYRLGASWRFAAAYVYDQAKVTREPDQRGARRQVPAAGSRASRLDPRCVCESDVVHLAAGVQFVGSQFDDDLNTGDAAAAEIRACRPDRLARARPQPRALRRRAEPFDAEYFVGTLPTTVGAPRLVTGGIR